MQVDDDDDLREKTFLLLPLSLHATGRLVVQVRREKEEEEEEGLGFFAN